MPLTEKESYQAVTRGTHQPLGFQIRAGVPELPLYQIRATLEAIANDPNTPEPTANTARATVWMVDVQAFRLAEDGFLSDSTYESSLGDHRVFLAELIAAGEAVVASVRRSGLMEGSERNKFTLSDLIATLDSLHTTFECEHRPRNTQKLNGMVADLFNGSKS